MLETKVCTKCGEEKFLTEFYTKLNRGKLYCVAQCKVCQRLYTKNYTKQNPESHRRGNSKYQKTHRHVNQKAGNKWRKNYPEKVRAHKLKQVYGISVQDFQQLLIGQQERCAICKTTDTSPFPNFCIDHDHITGKIRGLLCHGCNVAIGRLKDDPELCREAANYLEQTK